MYKLNARKAVNALAVHNFFLVSGLNSGLIQVFDLPLSNQSVPARNLTGHGGAITDLKFINNGNLASSSTDKTVRVWDMSTYTLLFTNSDHNRSVLCVNVLPNGNIVSGSEDKRINVLDSNLFTNTTTMI